MAQARNCFACNEELGSDEATKHSCTFCRRALHKQCSLSTAAASSHLSAGFVCTFGCLQAFEAGRAYKRAEVGQPGCECSECGKTFSRPSNMKAHFQSKHQHIRHGPCVCCLPSVSFASHQRLQTHMESRRKAVMKALQQLHAEENPTTPQHMLPATPGDAPNRNAA
jgi:hypothetical protein